MSENQDDKSTWAIGSGLLIGAGIGFFFLEQTTLAFAGCMLSGSGLGILISAIHSATKGSK
jgi:hypothetical protein